jgi:hypothetical protein
MREAISISSNCKLELKRQAMGKDSPSVKVDLSNGEIILNTDFRFAKKKKANTAIQAVEIAYHAARAIGGSEESKHKLFLDLVKDILDAIL